MGDLRSEVARLASEYKKAGYSSSDAFKQAWADIRQGKNSIDAASNSVKGLSGLLSKLPSLFGSLSFGLDGIGSKISGVVSNVIETAGKVAAAGATAAAAGVGAIVKQSVDEFANYEQLVGGVETLYKDSAGKLKGYADEAYKTAGLSANDYMETATSFAATLVQSLGGDTEQAADMANMAITDMADNANKMGSEMQTIIGTYQSLARGNYTMLDNLNTMGALAA